MPADLDGQMTPVGVEDVKRVVVDIGHRLFSFDVVLRADIPHCPASALMRQKGRVEEGSDCLIDQAGSGCHGRRSRRIAGIVNLTGFGQR